MGLVNSLISRRRVDVDRTGEFGWGWRSGDEPLGMLSVSLLESGGSLVFDFVDAAEVDGRGSVVGDAGVAMLPVSHLQIPSRLSQSLRVVCRCPLLVQKPLRTRKTVVIGDVGTDPGLVDAELSEEIGDRCCGRHGAVVGVDRELVHCEVLAAAGVLYEVSCSLSAFDGLEVQPTT